MSASIEQQQHTPKHRLSSLFHKQKSSETFNPASSSNHGPDSAYAAPSQRTSPANTVPIENTGQIQGVDQDVNLALNESTGEVVDEDTGEVITTVTTTTTTTTTTVRKGARGRSQQRENKETNVHVETHPGAPSSTTSSAIPPAEGDGGIVEAPGDNSHLQPSAPNTTRDRSHSPALRPPRIETHTPTPQEQQRQRSRSPAPPQQQQQQYPDPTGTDPLSTPLPPRSPHRKSAELPSPVRPNFSHPSRSHVRGTGAVQGENVNGYEERHYAPPPPPPLPARQEQVPISPVQTQGSGMGFLGRSGSGGWRESMSSESRGSKTFENLKMAAIGLHGVGETLRSTLNSAADTKFPRRDAEKNAYAEAKNRAEMERGQREMARLRERRGLSPTVRKDECIGGAGVVGAQGVVSGGGSGADGGLASPPVRPTMTSSSSSQAPQLQPQSSLAAPGTWGSGSTSTTTASRPSVARGDTRPSPPSTAPPPSIPSQQQETLTGNGNGNGNGHKEGVNVNVNVKPVTTTHPAYRRQSQGEQGFEHRAQNAAASVAGRVDSHHLPPPSPSPYTVSQTGGNGNGSGGLGIGEPYTGGGGMVGGGDARQEEQQQQQQQMEHSKRGLRGLFKRREK